MCADTKNKIILSWPYSVLNTYGMVKNCLKMWYLIYEMFAISAFEGIVWLSVKDVVTVFTCFSQLCFLMLVFKAPANRIDYKQLISIDLSLKWIHLKEFTRGYCPYVLGETAKRRLSVYCRVSIHSFIIMWPNIPM